MRADIANEWCLLHKLHAKTSGDLEAVPLFSLNFREGPRRDVRFHLSPDANGDVGPIVDAEEKLQKEMNVVLTSVLARTSGVGQTDFVIDLCEQR